MLDPSIREKVDALKREIAVIRAANQAYRSKRYHNVLEQREHVRRTVRLEEIMRELAALTNRHG